MPRTKFHQISHDAARELLWSQRINGGGRIFGVAFDRISGRIDGSADAGRREVVYCRFNVRKHLKSLQNAWIHPDGTIRRAWVRGSRPAGAAYDRADKDVMCVYVTSRKTPGDVGYRCIHFTSIRWLKLDGITYRVGAPPPPQH